MGKQLLGLGSCEGRNWQGWHRHMTLCLLLPFCLLQDKLALTKKKSDLILCQVAEILEVMLARLCHRLRNGCARLQGIRDRLLGRVAAQAEVSVRPLGPRRGRRPAA